MKVLGIETSCDENSASVVKDGQHLLSNVIFSQVDLHKMYGGVVPEVAARSHIEVMLPTIQEALDLAFPNSKPSNQWEQIDAIAVTNGPGLGGSLLIGTLTARTLALVKNKPVYAMHHALGHIYANFIDWTTGDWGLKIGDWQEPKFPVLALIVSGGHTHLVLLKDYFDYRLLGQTRDDAVGEAFDKVAKVLGLAYPGGPSIQEASSKGDVKFLKLPIAKVDGYDFSFSGLKTAVLRAIQALVGVDHDFPSLELKHKLSEAQVRDIAASFQFTAVKTLVEKTVSAYEEYRPETVVIAGGVAANTELRRQLKNSLPISINYAPISLCTDNAAMIASLGYYKSQHSEPDDLYALEVNPSLSL